MRASGEVARRFDLGKHERRSPTLSIALFNMEGTVTVSTDHTSGSSLETAADMAADSHFATPAFGDMDQMGDAKQLGEPDQARADSPGSHDDGEPHGGPLSEDLAGGSVGDTLQSTPQETDAIEFRVIRPGVPVRRLRLTGNRYTFGSAEGCSIRLNDHALRPMHAVLIRDASRILIRAYSVPVQVNGTRMTESTLQCGDVLRLGAYQFELLSFSKRPSSSGTRFQILHRPAIDL